VEFDSSYPSSDGLFVAHGISKLIKSSASSVEQNNSEFETINVYPNPSMGEVFVSGLKAGSYVEVWSTEGQLLMKRNFESENHDAMKINISGHPSGVLYFRIYSETSIQVKKIILK
jgi:hypothetical protein